MWPSKSTSPYRSDCSPQNNRSIQSRQYGARSAGATWSVLIVGLNEGISPSPPAAREAPADGTPRRHGFDAHPSRPGTAARTPPPLASAAGIGRAQIVKRRGTRGAARPAASAYDGAHPGARPHPRRTTEETCDEQPEVDHPPQHAAAAT